jgi:hypothetical protein
VPDRDVLPCGILGLGFVPLIAIRQYDPRLPAMGPEVDCWPHAGCIVKRPGTNDSNHARHLRARHWYSADPNSAVRANQPTLDASAICPALHSSCLPRQVTASAGTTMPIENALLVMR